MKDKIIQLEEELRLAMLSNDVAKLNDLIDDSLVFIGPDGSVISKDMDLAAHRAKLQTMSELIPREQAINIHENFAVVTVILTIKGRYGEIDISGDYRYLRIWSRFGATFRIVSGSVSKI